MADVLYVTRCQKERFESMVIRAPPIVRFHDAKFTGMQEDYEKVAGLYHVNAVTLKTVRIRL